MTKLRRSVIVAIAVAAVVAFVVYRLVVGSSSPEQLSLDGYLHRVDAGKVATATIHDKDHNITGKLHDGTEYKVSFPDSYTKTLTQALVANNVKDIETDHQAESAWMSLLFSLLPFALLALVLLWVLGQVQGGTKVMGFGKSRAKVVAKDQPQVTFGDVAGLDEAVEELEEIREFLAGFPLSGLWRWRVVSSHANGQPALGFYAWDENAGAYLPFALNVLSLRGEQISDVTAFVARSIEPTDRKAYHRWVDQPADARRLMGTFERFGLPERLD